jgi:hypothetical protein
LCAKDAEISNISEMSENCTSANEINLSICLGSNTDITTGNIRCTQTGSAIRIFNLRYSAIRGTQAAISPPSCGDNICNGLETCSDCASDCGACESGSGGSPSGGGGAGSVPDNEEPPAQIAEPDKEKPDNRTSPAQQNISDINQDNKVRNVTVITDTSDKAKGEKETIKEGFGYLGWSVIIILFILLILFMLFFLKRRKKKKETEERYQKREIKLAEEAEPVAETDKKKKQKKDSESEVAKKFEVDD